MMNKKQQEEMANIQDTIYDLAGRLIIEQESEPLLVAAALAATAMGLYKSVLSPDDYDSMIDVISNNRDIIKPFMQVEPTQTGPLH